MMRYAILLVLVVSVSAAAQNPVPDTTDWHRYIPLEVGNEWHFRWTYVSGSNPPQAEIFYYLYEVVGDSLVDGTVYTKLFHCSQSEGGSPPNCDYDFVLVRVDEGTATVLQLYEDGWEDLWLHYPCELNAPFSDTPRVLTCPFTAYPMAVVSGEAVDEYPVGGGVMTGSLTLKTYEIGGCGLYHLLSDAGLLYWKCVGEFSDYALEYAKLDGVEYGDPVIVVANESGLELPEQFDHVRVFPNPVRSVATVTFAMDYPGNVMLNVFDLQGRKMETITLGERPSGEHSMELDTGRWPSGLYQVRISGDQGFLATKGIIVIH